MKFGIGHSNLQLFENVGVFRFEVQTHLSQPFEIRGRADSLVDQRSGDVTFVNVFDDLRGREEKVSIGFRDVTKKSFY